MSVSFEVALQAYRPKLTLLAFKLTHDRTEAEDLVQEAMTRALMYRHQFRLGTKLEAWVYVIMRNAHHVQYRHRKRETLVDDFTWDTRLEAGDPERNLIAKERLELVNKLPIEQRTALDAAVHDDYETAAKRLGISVGTLKSRVGRARMKLKELDDA